MQRIHNKSGFSLTEMLIATGIMAVGLVMVATVFPVGVKLTSLTTERSIGAVASDEAAAKVQLYGLRDFRYWPAAQQVNPADPNLTYTNFSNYLFTNLYALGPNRVPGPPTSNDDILVDATWAEFQYPSVPSNSGEQPYHWSALCRRMSDKEVEVMVFVSRKTSTGVFRIQDAFYNLTASSPWPSPVAVNVQYQYILTNEQTRRLLTIVDGPQALLAADSRYFFDRGYTIVDNYSGKIYKILEVDRAAGTLSLTTDWQWPGYESDPANPPTTLQQGCVWVVPPAVGSDRYPCIGVYPYVLRFDYIQ
jgi:prepilin-type N-terminal cleavage/methylation domain-containing protein